MQDHGHLGTTVGECSLRDCAGDLRSKRRTAVALKIGPDESGVVNYGEASLRIVVGPSDEIWERWEEVGRAALSRQEIRNRSLARDAHGRSAQARLRAGTLHNGRHRTHPAPANSCKGQDCETDGDEKRGVMRTHVTSA